MSISTVLQAALDGRYQIERELGQGGMATVFLADDVRHQRQVAIKVLREDLAASMGSARFLREIQIAAQLQHPHILPLLDSGDAGGLLYYVMPYVRGQSLRERLDREGELPVPEAVRLISEVADALAHAHELGVIHRDIKPDNVMLSGRHALVTDFGVAKAVSEAGGRQGVTTLGMAVGTPAYMSPEQAAADPHVDQRSDIYALGIMAYELLTGRPPFTGGTSQQVLAAQVTETPDPVSRHRASISPELEAVVMRCLEKRPADRWQTAAELLAQLEPLATPGTGITPATLRPVARRRSWMPWMVALAGVAGLAALGALAWRRPRAAVAPAAWERLQLTTTGDAYNPVVGPDGKEIAYMSSSCADDGSCNARVVLVDLQTGTRQTLTDSMDYVGPTEWSGDGAWLLVLVFAPDRGLATGAYVVSHLGGPLTYLGGAGTLTAQGDTALATSATLSGQQVIYLRRWVAPWSGPIDSVRLAPPGGPAVAGAGRLRLSPSGKWLALEWSLINGGSLMYLYDRQGRAADSLRLLRTGTLSWGANGTSLLLGVRTGSGEAALERIQVNPKNGRLGTVDTISLGSSSAAPDFSLAPDGNVLAYEATEDGERVLWTLQAPRPGVFPQPVQRVRAASADFRPWISPDGSTIAYSAQSATTSGTTQQFFTAPFAGGRAQALTPALRDVLATTGTADGRHFIVATRSGSGARLTAYSVPDGRASPMGQVPDTAFSLASAGPDGVALTSMRHDTITVLDGHGAMLRHIVLPDTLGRIPFLVSSPGGSQFVTFMIPNDLAGARGADENLHLQVLRISGQDSLVPVTVAGVHTVRGAYWLKDGTLWWIGNEAADQRLAIYRVPAAGGQPVRGELLPFPEGCVCALSADGSRGAAVVSKPLTDIWVIRNFANGQGR